MKVIVSGFFLFIIKFSAFAQSPTIGLIYEESASAEGYTLFSPERNTNTYLINNCGEVVNQWDFSENPGLSSYLMEDGSVVRAGKDSVEVRDWDNNLVWSFHVNGLGVNQHHDIQPLPNGNIILLLADNYDEATILAQGKDSSYPGGDFRLDKLIELEPNGLGQANIVWEWKFFDHLIQDFDASKPNFGVVADHPELIDMNFAAEGAQDYTHVNAVDYNPELDQLMLSVRHLNEIIIIDHSTTSLEASGHTGGDYGKGGDILWRWGNPEVYGVGTIGDKQLRKQHDCKWITEGAHIGKISVFNNDGNGLTFGSSIHIIAPQDIAGVYPMASGAYLPITYDWSWNGDVLGETVQGSIKCGVQIMSNDNALIVESTKGRISEVSPAGDVVWVYEVPHGDAFYAQFSSPGNNGIFRAHRYHPNYAGFSGVTFNNTGIIEDQNAVSAACAATVDNTELISEVRVYPNPAQNEIAFSSDQKIEKIEIYSLQGKLLVESYATSINIENLPKGIYSARVLFKGQVSFVKVIKS